MDDPSGFERRDRAHEWRPASLIREHVGLAISAAVLLVAISRVYSLAGYDVETVRIVLREIDAVELALATLALIFPSLVLLSLLVGFTIARRRRVTRRPLVLLTLGFGIGYGLIAAPWTLLVLYASFAFMGSSRARSFAGSESVQNTVSWLLIGVAVAAILIGRSLTIPLEAVQTKSGDVVVGFVIADDDETLLIIREADSSALRVADVKSRSFCTMPRQSGTYDRAVDWLLRQPPLLHIRSDRPTYRACDQSTTDD